MLDKAGGKEHNITEAPPNELKLGEGELAIGKAVASGGVRQASFEETLYE